MSARAKQKGPSTISMFQYVVVTLGYIVSAAQHSVELSTAVKKRFCSAAAPLVCSLVSSHVSTKFERYSNIPVLHMCMSVFVTYRVVGFTGYEDIMQQRS